MAGECCGSGHCAVVLDALLGYHAVLDVTLPVVF